MNRPSHRSEDLLWEVLQIESRKQQLEYLDEVCAEDSALRKEMQRLLDAVPLAHQFAEQVLALQTTSLVPSSKEFVGDQIGPYRILEQIGCGGMGVVFMAQQKEPVTRLVALKIIRPGMDSREVIARFETERQALAMMDHPNIAKVFDAGTTAAGLPYFVMELIRGQNVVRFCDENRLSTRQRLELFVDICCGVQHAHHKGVIHRDLKPSNILVAMHDSKPVPKIIDFGVAKALAEPLTRRTAFTRLGQVVGTYQYMSPEQVRFNQLDVDTRTDVYSLGVLLYELITGEPPFSGQRLRSAALDEVIRVLRDETPMRPSARISSSNHKAELAIKQGTVPSRLISYVRGELDWIAGKALEKDRNRRYVSAQALGEDVQRHLGGRVVEAGPPSWSYRSRKFLQRHRGAVAAVASIVGAIILALVLLITFAWQQKQVAAQRAALAERKEQQRAEARRQAETVQREKDATTARLVDSLISEARSVRIAREVGYRNRLEELIAEAIRYGELEPAQRIAIRAELLHSAGDPLSIPPKRVGQVDVQTATPVAVYETQLPAEGGSLDGVPVGYAFSRDGSSFARPISSTGDSFDWISRFQGFDEIAWFEDGELKRTVPTELGDVRDLAIADDPSLLIACCEQGMVAWDTSSWRRTRLWFGQNCKRVAAHQTEPLLAGIDDTGRIRLWNLAVGEQLASWGADPPREAAATVAGGRPLLQSDVAFSAESSEVVVQRYENIPQKLETGMPAELRFFEVWSPLQTPERDALLGNQSLVTGLAWHPKRHVLACASEGASLRFSGRIDTDVPGHRWDDEATRIAAQCVGYAPHGKWLAVGNSGGGLEIRDAHSLQLLAERRLEAPVNCLAFDASCRVLFAGVGGVLRSWLIDVLPDRLRLEALPTTARSPNPRRNRRPQICSAVASNPRTADCVFRKIDRWELTGRLYRWKWNREPTEIGGGRSIGGWGRLRFGQDADCLLTLDDENRCIELDWQTGEPRFLFDVDSLRKADTADLHWGMVHDFAPSGEFLAVLFDARTVLVCSLPAGQVVFRLNSETREVTALRFSADGRRLAVGCRDGSVSIWKLDELERRLERFAVAPRVGHFSGEVTPASNSIQTTSVLETPSNDNALRTLAARHRAMRALRKRLASAEQKISDWTELSELHELQNLDVAGYLAFDTSALRQLPNLDRLERLVLRGTETRDADLEALQSAENLKVLDVSDTWITDAAFESLANIPSLEVLRLRRTPIQGTFLQSLKRLPRLRVIDLRETPLPASAIRKLLEAVPLTAIDITNQDPTTFRTIIDVDEFQGLRDQFAAVSFRGTGRKDQQPAELTEVDHTATKDLLDAVSRTSLQRGRLTRTGSGWQLQRDDEHQLAQLRFPSRIPDEFDLQLTLVRRLTPLAFGIWVSFPWTTEDQRTFKVLVLDDLKGSALHDYRLPGFYANSSTIARKRIFPVDVPVRVTIKVRREAMRVDVEDEPLLELKAPASDATSSWNELARYEDGFGLATYGCFELREFQMVPVH